VKFSVQFGKTTSFDDVIFGITHLQRGRSTKKIELMRNPNSSFALQKRCIM